MSTTRLTFELADITVCFDDSGALTSVQHHARNDGGYLAPGLVPSADEWQQTSLITDADEIEITYESRSRRGLAIMMRHTLSAGWGTRLAFSNTTDAAVTLDRFTLGLRPAAGHLGWAVPAGNTASYTVYPADGSGPLLGWTLRQGDVAAVDTDGIHLAPITIGPGSRYIVQLQWDVHDEPARRHRPGAGLVPPVLCLTDGEPIEVADEDTAIVVDDAVAITTVDGVRELVAERPGRYPIELRSGRGTTRFEMTWAQPETQALAAAAEMIVAGPRTPAGIPRVSDGSSALLVQHALAEMTIADPEQASDALELFSAGLLDREPSGVSTVEAAYLCGEWLRTGDTDLLAAARNAVLAVESPTRGLGMAATRLCVALMMAGRPVDQVLGHLTLILRRFMQIQGNAGEAVAALELILVVQSNINDPSDDLLTRIRALCGHLGYGLPGLAVDPIGADALGYLIAVLGLLPDRVGDRFIDSWGITPHALADRFRPLVISQSSGTDVRGLAWLVLGREP